MAKHTVRFGRPIRVAGRLLDQIQFTTPKPHLLQKLPSNDVEAAIEAAARLTGEPIEFIRALPLREGQMLLEAILKERSL